MIQRPRLGALTGLRIIAAGMVVLHHLQGELWIPAGTFGAINLGFGVSFFFCLSGFILHYNYRNKIAEISYPKFLFIRYFRLWPAHIAALLLVVFLSPHILTWLTHHLSNFNIAQVVFMLHSLTLNMFVYYAWNGPSWSVATEFWFYVAFPMLCLTVPKNPFFVLGATAVFVLIYLTLVQTLLLDPLIKGNAHGLGSISPVPRILEFAAGVVLCEVIIFKRNNLSFGTHWEVAAIGSVVALIWFAPNLSRPVEMTFGAVPRNFIDSSFAAPAFLLLIMVMAKSEGLISKFLAVRPMIWLGDVSFSIYLIHQPIIVLLFHRHIADSGLAIWQQIPLFLFLTVGISAGIFYLVEKPGIRLSRQFVKFGVGRSGERLSS